MGVEFNAEQRANLQTAAEQGVRVAEEYAARVLKRDGETLTGDQKLDIAMRQVQRDFKRPIPVDKVEAAVHAALAKLGLGASAPKVEPKVVIGTLQPPAVPETPQG
jgi:hypothetical protein